MKDTLNLPNLKRRVKAKKPMFWKKLQRLGGLFVAISGVFLIGAFPELLTKIATYMGAISATVVLVAEFATEDNLQNNTTK